MLIRYNKFAPWFTDGFYNLFTIVRLEVERLKII